MHRQHGGGQGIVGIDDAAAVARGPGEWRLAGLQGRHIIGGRLGLLLQMHMQGAQLMSTDSISVLSNICLDNEQPTCRPTWMACSASCTSARLK